MTTNHYGHFALTRHLFGLLAATLGARFGAIDFDDLDWRHRPYRRVQAYADSNLANLMFMRTLQGVSTRRAPGRCRLPPIRD